mmetsp:Transcript_10445/g.21487  ORF Transcript_10445/g.21487 Transcript_10445/m.21487 type:complete len:473 (-) Transcript_10445:380-1798(-)
MITLLCLSLSIMPLHRKKEELKDWLMNDWIERNTRAVFFFNIATFSLSFVLSTRSMACHLMMSWHFLNQALNPMASCLFSRLLKNFKATALLSFLSTTNSPQVLQTFNCFAWRILFLYLPIRTRALTALFVSSLQADRHFHSVLLKILAAYFTVSFSSLTISLIPSLHPMNALVISCSTQRVMNRTTTSLALFSDWAKSFQPPKTFFSVLFFHVCMSPRAFFILISLKRFCSSLRFPCVISIFALCISTVLLKLSPSSLACLSCSCRFLMTRSLPSTPISATTAFHLLRPKDKSLISCEFSILITNVLILFLTPTLSTQLLRALIIVRFFIRLMNPRTRLRLAFASLTRSYHPLKAFPIAPCMRDLTYLKATACFLSFSADILRTVSSASFSSLITSTHFLYPLLIMRLSLSPIILLVIALARLLIFTKSNQVLHVLISVPLLYLNLNLVTRRRFLLISFTVSFQFANIFEA